MPRCGGGTSKSLITIFILATCLSTLAFCGGKAPAVEPAAVPSADITTWYVLDGPNLVEIENSREIPMQRTLSPWTAATRIADFAEIGDTLCIGISGYGILTTDAAGPIRQGYRVLENPQLFQGRVLSSLFVREGKLYAHLYRNTTFESQSPEGPPVALVHLRLNERADWATDIRFQFQEEHPDWEAVEMLPAKMGSWKASWKKSGEETAFRHVSFAYPGGPEQMVNREDVMSAYRFKDIREAPEELWTLFTELADRGAKDVVYHITLRSPGSVEPQRFRAGSFNTLSGGRGHFRSIEAYQSADTTVILDPPQRLRIFGSDDEPKTIFLPTLPTGVQYTGLWFGGKTCVVAWEQRDFPDVGAAGIVLVDVGM